MSSDGAGMVSLAGTAGVQLTQHYRIMESNETNNLAAPRMTYLPLVVK